MSHFPSMCCSSPLTPQVLFYDGHDSHFGDIYLNIPHRHHIQSLIIKVGYYVHDQPKYYGPNMKFKNFYGNERINWMRHHETLKFTPPHMNSVLVETWEAFKVSSTKITQKYFMKTPPPPSPHRT